MVIKLSLLLSALRYLAQLAVNVYLPKDRVTSQHQGYGFVEFKSEDDADYVRPYSPFLLMKEPAMLLHWSVCLNLKGSRMSAGIAVCAGRQAALGLG